MRELFTNGSLTIAAGQAVSGMVRQAQTLRIASGQVWITQDGVPGDHWLSAGDTFAVAPGRLLVVEAHGSNSRLVMPSARATHPWSGWLARLRAPTRHASVATCQAGCGA